MNNQEYIDKILAVDFTKQLFRCHAVGNIMTNPTGKSPMQLYLDTKEQLSSDIERYDNMKTKDGVNGLKLKAKIANTSEQLPILKENRNQVLLSANCKSYLEKIFVKEVFGKERGLSSKFLDKGLEQEQDSFGLYSSVKGKFLKKNEERKQNEFISGEPDNVQDGIVRDFKTSWDALSFPLFEEEKINKGYWWQLQCYMWLFDLEVSELVYCLVNTPEQLILDEIRKEGWKQGFIEVPEEMEDDIRKNMTFDEIPEVLRVKNYDVERDNEAIEKLKNRIWDCRKYLIELQEKTLIKLKTK